MSSTVAASRGPALIATKLQVPRPRPGLVRRPELIDRLASGDGLKLALVCAPAGWGKTVLLSEWCASPREQRAFAWVSLDRGDSDPVRFWSYVLAALRTLDGDLGQTALGALPGAGSDLADVVVAPLINDLAAYSERIVLVLDDYHLVHSEPVHAAVAYLLRHLPGNVLLAISTRADPPLPFASLRAAGAIAEIRAAALRFTDAQAEALLNGSLGLGLDPIDIGLLQTRTEGWAAGLQLAALSLPVHEEDRHAFVETFAGDDRQIGDYLQEIVLEQPEATREFLLRTSILERMTAPLCDALTGAGDGAARLEQMERSNLFLVSLDTRREWYRYHHLFRELLRHKLDPALAVELHRRAAAWHRAQDNVEEAIAHATAAGDLDEAADLIAEHWRAFFNWGRLETVASWIDGLPRDHVLADPRLCLARIWVALYLGRLEEVEPLLRDPKTTLLPGPFHESAGSLEANMAFLESISAGLEGDVGRSLAAARRAVTLQPHEDGPARATATLVLGRALYFAGELDAAVRSLSEAVERLSGDSASVALTTALAGLGLAQIEAGDRAAGERSTTRAEHLVADLGVGDSAWAALPSISRGRLLELRGDTDEAKVAFERAVVLARRGGRRLDLGKALLSLAGVERRQRHDEAARSLTREARQVLDACPDPGALAELLQKTERALHLQRRTPARTVLPADLELSERELTILRLLATDLTQRQIGSDLHISVNTVKHHARNIFRKLGVTDRGDAVARARELALI